VDAASAGDEVLVTNGIYTTGEHKSGFALRAGGYEHHR
jgi:hypothetical protein